MIDLRNDIEPNGVFPTYEMEVLANKVCCSLEDRHDVKMNYFPGHNTVTFLIYGKVDGGTAQEVFNSAKEELPRDWHISVVDEEMFRTFKFG